MRSTIEVYVKLYATLATSLSQAISARHALNPRAGTRVDVELPEGSTLADLVAHLGLPPEQVKVIFVNAKAQDLDYRLDAGDEVGIFPPIGGG